MSDSPRSQPVVLDVDLARRIDAICRRFEADWRDGKKPAIEEYLGEISEPGRLALIAELKALENELSEADAAAPGRSSAAMAEAPTIAPIAASAGPTIHDEVTVGLRVELTTDLKASTATTADSSGPDRVRYFGDYEIIREVARGGMGVVFLARQVSLNRPVALKMILAGQLADDTDVRRFYTEAESAANLDHPGIVPIYEVGQHEGQHYFSMGFIDGQSLAQRLGDRPMPPRDAAELMIQVAEAIEYAHRRNVIHRDLKPGNILLDKSGNPRVTDFGLARKTETDSGLTGSGQIMGTPGYMPPEQAGGGRGVVGPEADVYALGATLYCTLTGRPPFQAATPMDTVIQVLSDEPVPTRRLNPLVPGDLDTICLKCLEKEPARRYRTAAAMAADLRRFLNGEPILARPVTRLERAAKWARRKPTLAAAYSLGLLTLLLGGLGGTAVWQWRAAERARHRETLARASAEFARTEAEQERDRADVARAEANRGRLAEMQARDETERLLEKVERLDYGRTIEVAHQEWRENNVSAALALLESTRADLRGWEWRYVHHLCHSELLTFRANPGAVAFSPDSSRIVIGSNDLTAKVLNAKSGDVVLTLRGHQGAVASALYSPDGTRILTGSWDKTAKVWDAQSGESLLTLSCPLKPESILLAPDGSRILTVFADRTAKVWDARSGNAIVTLKGCLGRRESSAFSPDSSRIVAACDDKTAKVWDAKAGKVLATLRGHARDIRTVAVSPDGTQIVTGSDDWTARVWDAATGTLLHTLKGHVTAVTSTVFNPDGSRILTAAGIDRTARVWDAKTGALLFTIKRNNGIAWGSFRRDGARILTGSYNDPAVKVWDARNGDEILTLKGHIGSISSRSWSPDGSRILAQAGDGTTVVWDAERSPEGLTLRPAGGVFSASFSPDGSRIVIGSYDVTGKVWDARRDVLIFRFKASKPVVFSASYSPDGTRFITASGDGTAQVRDARNGAELLKLQGHSGTVRSASFSPDGSRILTGSDDRTAKIWDGRTGSVLLTLTGNAQLLRSASFSPDGTRIVTGSGDGTARVWDARTGALLFTIKGHQGAVNSGSYSPDGSRIVTAGSDRTARLWDARKGAPILTLDGHTDLVFSASFSPDGSRIVTGSRDKTAKVWDTRSGVEVLTLKGHNWDVTSTSFSPDGTRILTRSEDMTARVWDAGPLERWLPRSNDGKPPQTQVSH